MSEVKAFVGHSFTDDDKDVVGRFVEFFNTLEKINTSFSWVHARTAEPKQLAEKVLALIQDRNLFIGICTKKERVVDAVRVLPVFNRLIAKADDLQWKTSDWVIQEIGLAVGRGMSVILLIEEGVRKPGGLQGDVEYIHFTREFPERAFTRIAEMVTAMGLNQVEPAVNVAATTTASAPVVAEQERETVITPEPFWEEDDFAFAQFRSVGRDSKSAEGIKVAYLKLPGETTETRQSIWRARDEGYRLVLGKGGDLSVLRALSENHPSNIEIKKIYARALGRFDKHDVSAELFEQAAAHARDDDVRAELLADAALAYVRADATAKLSAALRNLRAIAKTEKAKGELYRVLGELAKLKKDDYLHLAALEGEIDQSPAEYRKRFSLAYLHAQVGNADMALSHYLQIPWSERQAMDWNNLGAAYSHFRVNGRAVEAFRKSESMGGTLAMANLGFSLLQAGFVGEAKDICDKAVTIQGFHKNVGQLAIALRDHDETETKSVDATLDEAKPRIAFYNLFGVSLGLPELTELASIWTGPECQMILDINDGQVKFSGSFERDPNPLAGALALPLSKKPTRHELRYTGVLRGRSVIGTVKRSSNETSLSLLSAAGEDERILMVMSETEILALDPSSPSGKPIVFKRYEAPSR